LNDHGPDHIDKVIERASNLVDCKDCDLSPFEVYLLLISIQVHDAGNIFGREEHENKLEKIMAEAEKLCGRDEIERTVIRKIAQAHGGENRGLRDVRDKIGQELSAKEALFGEEVRPRVIASILRFADELSDDKSRANLKLLEENRIPKKSEVFHAYAACLESVLIKHDKSSILLRYRIPKNFTLRRFGKLEEEVYLLDEIYARVMKMHRERIYCMRFCKKLLNIETIEVLIEFYSDFIDDNLFTTLSFALSESGYPEETKEGIYGLCRTLTDFEGKKIDGEYVKNKISGAAP
jgi:hypothetical protein